MSGKIEDKALRNFPSSFECEERRHIPKVSKTEMYNKDSEYYLRNYFLKKIYKNK